MISFGANLGDPIETIRRAASLLRQSLDLDERHFRLSRLFRTPPVGGPVGQPPFVNAVAAIYTTANPWQIWRTLRDIEIQLGRQRNERWEARTIDLDILLFAQQRIWTPHLKIPHPRMAMRRFVLLPALDVAADWLDPVTNMSLATLANRLRMVPTSVVVVGGLDGHGKKIAVEAARLAMCEWLDLNLVQPELELAHRAQHRTNVLQYLRHSDQSRWLGYLPADVHGSEPPSISMPATVTLFLGSELGSQEVAWEDYNRQLAEQLGFCEPPLGMMLTQRWSISGPRYLLPVIDDAWAVHEIVSAFEAMDCPVEPIVEV